MQILDTSYKELPVQTRGCKLNYDAVYYCTISALLLYMIIGIWGRNYLFADGSNFLYGMLRNQSFVLWPVGRMVSLALMEFFPVLAMKCGVINPAAIAGLYGLGCTVWTVTFYTGALTICRQYGKPQYLAVTALLASIALFYVGFFVQIESITSLSFFTCLFVALLLYGTNGEEGTKSGNVKKVFLLTGSVMTIGMNEFFLLWSPVIIALLVMRLRRGELKRSIYWYAHIAIQTAAVLWAIHGIMYKGNSSQSGSIAFMLTRIDLLIVLALILCIFALSFRNSKVSKKVNMLLKIVLPFVLLYFIYFHGNRFASMNYYTRQLNLFAGLCFAVFLLLSQMRSLRLPSIHALNFTMLASMIAITVVSAVGYRGYLRTLSDFCRQHEGAGTISLQQTDSGAVVNNPYYWGWTIPFEGLAIQIIEGKREISCIVYTEDGWSPFDTSDISLYADLSAYGVSYYPGQR